MNKFATIYCLLYGNYLSLQQRLLLSLKKYAPADEVQVVIWCNELTPVCREQVEHVFPGDSAKKIFSDTNVPKYLAMREMFHNPATGAMPQTPWIIWFDDDSHIVAKDWWRKTRAYIDRMKRANICYFGQPWFVHHLPGQWDFISAAAWFAGLPPAKMPTKSRAKKPGIMFAQGSYWWLRTDIMKQLDWPDPRLRHNGGDTLLAEAIRQRGLPRHDFSYGVKLNDAKRRGFHEAPAGAKNRDARR